MNRKPNSTTSLILGLAWGATVYGLPTGWAQEPSTTVVLVPGTQVALRDVSLGKGSASPSPGQPVLVALSAGAPGKKSIFGPGVLAPAQTRRQGLAPEELALLEADPFSLALGSTEIQSSNRRGPLGRPKEDQAPPEEEAPPAEEAPQEEPPATAEPAPDKGEETAPEPEQAETPAEATPTAPAQAPQEETSEKTVVKPASPEAITPAPSSARPSEPLLPLRRRDRFLPEDQPLEVEPEDLPGGEDEKGFESASPRLRELDLPPLVQPEPWVQPTDPNVSDYVVMDNRWETDFPEYEMLDRPLSPLDPYHQSEIKGDYPFWGKDLFAVFTAQNFTLFEYREIPIPSPPSANDPGSFGFFGDDDQEFFKNTFKLTMDVYHGKTSFLPPTWRFHSTFAFDYNDLTVEENGIVHPDPRRGVDRSRYDSAIEEMYMEFLLEACAPKFDFTSVRVGIQPFVSDFRGLIYNDTNLGVRLFGSQNNNKLQWNLAAFRQLEKDTNSELNSTTLRDQYVFIANMYRQDFLWLGYTAQLSFHANLDNDDFFFDDNGFLVRPDPIGSATPHEIEAYYLGWAGDGHIGEINVNHAFYQVLGEDSLNPIAGVRQEIDAQLAALEFSIDRDWFRPKLSMLWASGDDNPRDHRAEGFDGIFENANFAGGQFSYWNRQGIRATGTAVGLNQRGSPYTDLTNNKLHSQSNYVNPGLFLFNGGFDIEVTPKLKTLFNANWLFFDSTEPLELVLQQPGIDREIGWDLSLGLEYRPFFTNNIIVKGGVATLIPSSGFKQIATSDDLYSGFLEVILTY